jgi:hypothetical protein
VGKTGFRAVWCAAKYRFILVPMSHKLLNFLREIRPNAVWDFIKLGVGLMLASFLGLGYWLMKQYREAPFSVMVMFGIFLTS